MAPFEEIGDISETSKHWVGMPEYVQEGKEEHQKIIVRFECEEDVKAFAELLDRELTPLTRSIWYPRKRNKEMNKEHYYGD